MRTVTLSLDGLERIDERLKALADDIEAAANAGTAPLELHEAAELYNRALEIRAAQDGETAETDGPDHLPKQITVGAAVLKSPSMAANILLEKALDWSVKQWWYNVFTAYVLAHGDDEAAIRAVSAGRDQADPIIREWGLCLTATDDELERAVALLYRNAVPKAPDGKKKGANANATPGESCSDS